jgi:hypothetical protein
MRETTRKIRPRRRREDNIKMNLTEIGWGGKDWSELAWDRNQGGGGPCEHGNEPSGSIKWEILE